MLRDGGQDVNREFVCMWIVHRDELNTRVHQRRDEGQVARQAIELGDDQLGLLPLADRQSLLEFGPLVALTALDLGELADQRPGAAVQVLLDGMALCVQAKPTLALFVCADAKVGDKPAPIYRTTHQRFLSDVTPLELQSPWFQ
jgi:hypothetical protein